MAEKEDEKEDEKDNKKDGEKDNNSSRNEDQPIPILEWFVAAIGLIMVLGAIGFITYKTATNGNKPPILKVTYNAPEKNEAGYLVKFEVENTGDETAAAVVIEGKIMNGAEEVETSSATFDYAPSQSKVSGGLYFKNNPQEFNFEISPKGYQKP